MLSPKILHRKLLLKIQAIKLLLDENQIKLAKKEVEAILNLLNERNGN